MQSVDFISPRVRLTAKALPSSGTRSKLRESTVKPTWHRAGALRCALPSSVPSMRYE
ncbi:MAG: hypothetical protein ACI96P_002439 [Candidatus Azotimanducaceae bacterium]|jgi:hypothetical protein